MKTDNELTRWTRRERWILIGIIVAQLSGAAWLYADAIQQSVGIAVRAASSNTWQYVKRGSIPVPVEGIAGGTAIPISFSGGITTTSGTQATESYNLFTTVSTSNLDIDFGFVAKIIQIETATGNTAAICVDYLGSTAVCPATGVAGDDTILASRIITLDNFYTSSVNAISASGSQSFYIRAWGD
jgi:hypothetical protein